jgi:two-component system, OmpR family, response regulator
MRALVVEDSPDVAQHVAHAMAAAGFVVDHAADGEDAWFRGDTEDYDVVILDLGLPKLDGLSILKRWRGAGRLFPVLILSARGDWIEKVEGIEAGADDYMGKPFEMGELVARARGLVRRAAGRGVSVMRFGNLILDTLRMSATVNGTPVRLSPLEYRLLNYLAHQPGRPVAAGEIADHLYGLSEQTDVNTVEALVTRLRRKLGADVIETRRGFGYLLGNSA